MIAFEIWLAYTLAASLVSVIPGPTVLLVITRALEHGRRSASPLTCGVMVGDAVALVLSIAGLGALLATSAVLFTLVKWLGAVYLIWLGVTLWRQLPVIEIGDNTDTTAKTGRSLFMEAMVVTALNPKSIIFFIAFLPQFADTDGNVPLQLCVLGATFVVIGGINAFTYALFAGGLKGLLARDTASRRFRRCGGGALIGAGLWAATVQRA